jgi:flagellar M-ring protein FliF
MSELINNFLALGRRRLIILGGVTAALMVAVFFGLSAVATKDFAVLYRGLSLGTANSIEASLVSSGFQVEVSDDGSSVSVPREDMVRARMVLAETGLPVDGEPGWELFDESSGLAMNSFLQKINRLRAMEGELARSIQTLEGIQSARVHLVLLEREPFSREESAPRASIIARATAGRVISRKQAESIRNLVASAVPELDLTRVTVLSASGETILAEGPMGDGQSSSQSAKSAIEDRLSREIQDILTARVGAGNARVRVNVELTAQHEVIVEQNYNPDQQVVRSTENKTESQAGNESGGNVGVENGIPAALADPNGGATSQQSKSGEVVTYEIGSTRRETVREAGDIKRISVAVLVNGIYNVDGSTVAYADRDVDEINRLTELVKASVGFSDSRGDSVSVDSMRFMDYSMDLGEPIGTSMSDQLAQNVVPLVRGLIALSIVALVIILGVRPALRHLKEATVPQLANDPVEGVATANTANATKGVEAASLPPPETGDAPKASKFDPAKSDSPGEYFETIGIRGSLLKARVEALRDVADQKPDEVLRVLRSWLGSEAEA